LGYNKNNITQKEKKAAKKGDQKSKKKSSKQTLSEIVRDNQPNEGNFARPWKPYG